MHVFIIHSLHACIYHHTCIYHPLITCMYLSSTHYMHVFIVHSLHACIHRPVTTYMYSSPSPIIMCVHSLYVCNLKSIHYIHAQLMVHSLNTTITYCPFSIYMYSSSSHYISVLLSVQVEQSDCSPYPQYSLLPVLYQQYKNAPARDEYCR